MADLSTTVLPNLFIIGAAKSGTTSLHSYLGAHPEISMSEPKEPHLFTAAAWQERIGSYGRMLSPDAPIRGESSTHYTFYPTIEGVPERIASTCPDARLIYLVRDPVERIVAHYVETYALLYEHRTLATVLWDFDQAGNRYVAASRYALQLEQWLRCFERDRILVIDQLDLRERRTETLREVFEFLQVSPVVPPEAAVELNVSNAKERMTPTAARLAALLTPALRRLPSSLGDRVLDSRLFPVEKIGKPALDGAMRTALEAELRPDAERFRELTGKQFASWSV